MIANLESLEAVHTHTHTHTRILLVNEREYKQGLNNKLNMNKEKEH